MFHPPRFRDYQCSNPSARQISQRLSQRKQTPHRSVYLKLLTKLGLGQYRNVKAYSYDFQAEIVISSNEASSINCDRTLLKGSSFDRSILFQPPRFQDYRCSYLWNWLFYT